MVKKEVSAEKPSGPKIIYTTGKRKTAIAKVKLIVSGKGLIVVNKKNLEDYFPWFELKQVIFSPLELTSEKNFDFEIEISGGGLRAQTEAIRLGIARALILYKPELRPILKQAGFLRRDARIKERKKPGLKRARRAPQWQKR